MITDPSNSCIDSVPLAELPVDAALDAPNSLGVRCPPPLREAKCHRPLAPGKPLRLMLAGKAGLISSAKVLWAGPWSLWGLGIGGVGLLTGGGVQWNGRVLEFWGGLLPLFLKYFPFVAGSPVATFGHVILGRSKRHLDACRPHQMVHVKQYECWGPLFVPAYLTCWCVLWCCGKRPYYDNPFERQAYGQTS
jgi:hypothetical protein